MTTKAPEDWVALLTPLLADYGLLWEKLSKDCSEIILFGSQAAGVSRNGSDFDLLCVGSGRSQLGRSLDVVFVTLAECKSQQWLGSELAGHVARYGQCLKGEWDWASQIRTSLAAIERKADKIRHRLHAVEKTYSLLDACYLEKHFALTRRDLQRLECLLNGEPVPPTPLLDQAWTCLAQPQAELERLARKAKVDSKFLLERLSVPECWNQKGPSHP